MKSKKSMSDKKGSINDMYPKKSGEMSVVKSSSYGNKNSNTKVSVFKGFY